VKPPKTLSFFQVSRADPELPQSKPAAPSIRSMISRDFVIIC
jgi:hypothetical protein